MSSIFKILKPSNRKLVISLISIILIGFVVVVIQTLGDEGSSEYNPEKIKGWLRSLVKVEEYVFSTTSKIDAEDKKKFESFLNVGIPESVKDIYICWGGRDMTVFCSLNLPSEEVYNFVETFAGVDISEFQKGKISKISFVNKGPIVLGAKKEALYWNLKDVKQSKYYEVVEEHECSGNGRFIVIDIDANRIYMCVWSS